MVGLRLDFTPAHPSLLRHSFIPRSPASPLESVAKRTCLAQSNSDSDSTSESSSSTDSWTSDPPPTPCKWMWYCHHCYTGYQLGVTRRCLIDDHELCYGEPVKKRSKKGRKKNRACRSEFDYTGWQNYGAWKRSQSELESQDKVLSHRNCGAFCDWPSQCRRSCKEEPQAGAECHPQIQESSEPAASEAIPEPNATSSPVAVIRTAAQKLTTQWASLLAPIEEEPVTASIEEFLELAKAKTTSTLPSEQINVSDQQSPIVANVPFIAPLENAEEAGNSPSIDPTADTKSLALGFDFDFGFNRGVEEEPTPLLNGGLHNLVAGTVGIALSVPAPTTLANIGGTGGEEGRRCLHAPSSSGTEPQDRRRSS
ncbi:MAG: hypothetical protein Q9219_006561 [cf. Caloplaca sp. 3 TL-2023]